MVLVRVAHPYAVLGKERERVESLADWDKVPTFLKLKKVLKRRKGWISWVLEALLLSHFSFTVFKCMTIGLDGPRPRCAPIR
jgi:hypothetical protein